MRHAAALRRAQLPHQHGAGVRDRVERAVDLRAAQHHEPVGGAPQVQRLGAAGNGSRQQVFGNRDEIALRSGLQLRDRPRPRSAARARQGPRTPRRCRADRGAAPAPMHEQMRAPDAILLDHPMTRRPARRKSLPRAGRTRLLDEAGPGGE